MVFIKKEHKKFSKNSYKYYVLGGDIGGTNTNLGVFGVKNKKPILLLSFHFKSKGLKSLDFAIKEVLKQVNIKIKKACLSIAGVISSDGNSALMTNIRWVISKNALKKKTGLDYILSNDFEAVGYGINLLQKNSVKTIKKAAKVKKAPIVAIGAGTGLGKTILRFDDSVNSYVPMRSEGGLSDFPAQTPEEIELVNFVRKSKGIKASLSNEEVLSGRGLEIIYRLLRKKRTFKETKYTKEIAQAKDKPILISKYRKLDNACKQTYHIFKKNYAKFARNCALDALPYGGVYIAGGIASRNIDIFDREFVKIFEQHHRLSHVLRKIPIFLIKDYNVGMLGAGFIAAKSIKR